MPLSSPEDPLVVVLVGITGEGKSSTGNTLSNSTSFATSSGFSSATEHAEHADYMFVAESSEQRALAVAAQGAASTTREAQAAREDEALLEDDDPLTFCRVIDTIGLHDTSLPREETLNQFAEFAEHAPNGVTAFAFVLRYGRFTPEADAALETFARNCGEDAVRRCILVFTHVAPAALAALEAEHGHFAGALGATAPPSLRAWAARCAAVVAIDNIEMDRVAARRRLHEALFVTISREPIKYSNAVLAAKRKELASDADAAAFADAVADWRKRSGPLVVVRE